MPILKTSLSSLCHFAGTDADHCRLCIKEVHLSSTRSFPTPSPLSGSALRSQGRRYWVAILRAVSPENVEKQHTVHRVWTGLQGTGKQQKVCRPGAQIKASQEIFFFKGRSKEWYLINGQYLVIIMHYFFICLFQKTLEKQTKI